MHRCTLLREFFAKNSTHVAPQPPYPNRFESIEEIESETVRALKAIPTTTFQHASNTGGNVGTSALWSEGLFGGGRCSFGGINKDFSFYNRIHLTF